MANKVQSKCLGCGDIFTVDVRNRGRQKYCPKRACRATGKAARPRRWLGKPENQDYFSGPEHVERVRTWRAAHPGYWRSHRRAGGVALQDASLPRACIDWLIAHLSDSALQDDIASTTRGLLQLGQDILSGQKPQAPQTSAAP
jgi:hypothetical protein